MASSYPVQLLNDILTAYGRQSAGTVAGIEIYTTRSLERLEATTLKMPLQSIQINQASRISEQVIKDGKAFFFWRKDRFSSHLDLMEIQLVGVTRSLAQEPLQISNPYLQRLVDTAQDKVDELLPPFLRGTLQGVVGPTSKQAEWLRFWSITRENYVDADGINTHFIRLRLPSLPTQVEFSGHFAGPVQWSQNAMNPFLVDWNLKLVVHSTNPSLDVIFNEARNIAFVG